MMFAAPGALFIGQVHSDQQKFLKEILVNAKAQGFTRVIEPCAGSFAMSNLAVQAGFKPEQIEASDVTLYSSVLGYAIMDKPLDDLEIKIKGLSDEDCKDYATVLYAICYHKLRKAAGNDYGYSLLRDLEINRSEHISRFQEGLHHARKILYGLKYRPLDLIDHLREVKSDEKTIIIAQLPTYKGGYEQQFNFGDIVQWKEPSYNIFDPVTGRHDVLVNLMGDAPALILAYEECKTGETEGYPIFCRKGSRGDFNVYQTTNHKDIALVLSHGTKITRASEDKLQKLNSSIMPLDYEITENTKIGIKQISASVARYYRNLWTHNFQGGSGKLNLDFALFADGLLWGVMGIALQAPASVAGEQMMLIYGITPQHSYLRLHRLMVMLSLSKPFLAPYIATDKMRKYKYMQTSMITKYPESKEMRGVMKCYNKDKSKLGYKLQYRGELTDKKSYQILKEYLKKEQEWRMKRQKAKSQQ